MTTVAHVLERLAQANDRQSLGSIWRMVKLRNKHNNEVMKCLGNIQKITNTWTKNRRVRYWR